MIAPLAIELPHVYNLSLGFWERLMPDRLRRRRLALHFDAKNPFPLPVLVHLRLPTLAGSTRPHPPGPLPEGATPNGDPSWCVLPSDEPVLIEAREKHRFVIPMDVPRSLERGHYFFSLTAKSEIQREPTPNNCRRSETDGGEAPSPPTWPCSRARWTSTSGSPEP